MKLNLSETDLNALEAVVATEAGRSWDGSTQKNGVAAIVDTILNRVAHPAYPDTVSEVINQWAQFSDINSIQKTAHGSWQKVPERVINRKNEGAVRAAVQRAVAERAAGVSSSVAGHLHYGNYRHVRAKDWPAARDGGWLHAIHLDPYLRIGSGSEEHVHGTDPNMLPLEKAPAIGFLQSTENAKPGIDDRDMFDAPAGLDRVAPPVPTAKNGTAQTNPFRELLLDRIENPTDFGKRGPRARLGPRRYK